MEIRKGLWVCFVFVFVFLRDRIVCDDGICLLILFLFCLLLVWIQECWQNQQSCFDVSRKMIHFLTQHKLEFQQFFNDSLNDYIYMSLKHFLIWNLGVTLSCFCYSTEHKTAVCRHFQEPINQDKFH